MPSLSMGEECDSLVPQDHSSAVDIIRVGSRMLYKKLIILHRYWVQPVCTFS